MTLFVGYGYDTRDAWIEQLMFPPIPSFDSESESGNGLKGEVLSNTAKKRIEKSRSNCPPEAGTHLPCTPGG